MCTNALNVLILHVVYILAVVSAQHTRAYQALPTPQSVAYPNPHIVVEPALVVDLPEVPDGTLGKCALNCMRFILSLTSL